MPVNPIRPLTPACRRVVARHIAEATPGEHGSAFDDPPVEHSAGYHFGLGFGVGLVAAVFYFWLVLS